MAVTEISGVKINKITKSQYEAEKLAGNITTAMEQNEVWLFTDDQFVSSADKTNWDSKSTFDGNYNSLTNKPTIPTVPTNVSSFTNDAGYITSVPSEYITETELTSAISGKANTSDIPTKTSQLTNDSNFATTSYVDGKVSSVYKYKGSVASQSALPTTGMATGDVYNTNDTGMNYAWTGSDWDALGSSIDLSNYVTNQNLSQTLTDYVTNDELASVATSGSYNDLTNKPTLFSGSYNDLTNKPTLFSGSYNDLTNKPTIPTAVTKIWE